MEVEFMRFYGFYRVKSSTLPKCPFYFVRVLY